jgi:hypothetical protein
MQDARKGVARLRHHFAGSLYRYRHPRSHDALQGLQLHRSAGERAVGHRCSDETPLDCHDKCLDRPCDRIRPRSLAIGRPEAFPARYRGSARRIRFVGLLWVLFAPMHPRGTAGLSDDISHLVFAGVQILVMVLFMALGSSAGGTGFRIYSAATIVATLVFGILPGTQAAAIAAGQPLRDGGSSSASPSMRPCFGCSCLQLFSCGLTRHCSRRPPPSELRPIVRHAV